MNKTLDTLVNNKSAIIFSHNDLDGMGCIILGLLTFRKCKYKMNTYQNINSKITDFLLEDSVNSQKSFDYLFITDISMNDETIVALNNSPYKDCWILIDHHDTRTDLHNGINMFVLTEDPNGELNCGTNLFMEYLENKFNIKYNQTTEYFVDLVRLWDTWTWKAKEVDTAVDLDLLRMVIGNFKFIKQFFPRLKEDSLIHLFSHEDRNIIEKKRKDIDYYFINTKDMIIENNNHKIAYIMAEDYTSLLADMFMTKNSEADYLVILNMRRGVGSIRTTKDDIHVGKLAESLTGEEGGGGHQKAAGFQITEEFYNRILIEGVEPTFSNYFI